MKEPSLYSVIYSILEWNVTDRARAKSTENAVMREHTSLHHKLTSVRMQNNFFPV
jgi:hypothetical protein